MSDNFWKAGKQYAPDCYRDLRNSFDQKALEAARKWDAGSARDFWTWVSLAKSAGNWTLGRLCTAAPHLAKLGPESWLGAGTDALGIGKAKLLVKGVQGGMRLIKGIGAVNKASSGALKTVRGVATAVEQTVPKLGTPSVRLARQLGSKGIRAAGQDWSGTGGSLSGRGTAAGPGSNLTFEPMIINRSRPKPLTFKPDIVEHSPAFKKYGFAMPTGRKDVFPNERMQVKPDLRQEFLRDYYKSNPQAKNNARAEARSIINLANREFGPRPYDWKSNAIPPAHLQSTVHQGRPGEIGWGEVITRSRPTPKVGSLSWMAQGLR